MLSAAASQGLVWRWDIDTGLAQCDRFLYVNDDFIKVNKFRVIISYLLVIIINKYTVK